MSTGDEERRSGDNGDFRRHQFTVPPAFNFESQMKQLIHNQPEVDIATEADCLTIVPRIKALTPLIVMQPDPEALPNGCSPTAEARCPA